MKLKLFLIFIALLKASVCFAQDIHILGTFRESDFVSVKYIMNAINNNIKIKNINIYYNSTRFYSYTKKENFDFLNDKELEIALMNILQFQIANNPIAPSELDINNTIDKIKFDVGNEKRIINFDKAGKDNYPESFNNIETLKSFFEDPKNKKLKFELLFIFTKNKPVVKIQSPKTDQTVSSPKISGISTGSDSISNVFIKVNDGIWKKVVGTSDWVIESTLKKEVQNTIYAIAVDKYQDTSLTDSVSNVIYNVPEISFVYPNESKNVVLQCKRSNEYSYNFKIRIDPNIDTNEITIVVDDVDGKNISKYSWGEIPEIRKIPHGNKYVEYCFFLPYTITGLHDICSINSEDDYFYHISYLLDGNINIILPEKIKIHFTSFTSDANQYESCQCD